MIRRPWYCFTGLGFKVAPGLVNFVPGVAYPTCLALPAAFAQPGTHLLGFSRSLYSAAHVLILSDLPNMRQMRQAAKEGQEEEEVT